LSSPAALEEEEKRGGETPASDTRVGEEGQPVTPLLSFQRKRGGGKKRRRKSFHLGKRGRKTPDLPISICLFVLLSSTCEGQKEKGRKGEEAEVERCKQESGKKKKKRG